jgi:N-acetylglucosamine-6-sulfatase
MKGEVFSPPPAPLLIADNPIAREGRTMRKINSHAEHMPLYVPPGCPTPSSDSMSSSPTSPPDRQGKRNGGKTRAPLFLHPRQAVLLLTSVVLAVGLLFFGAYTTTGRGGDMRMVAAQAAPAKPNIVFILADDMRKDDLKYMPKTRSLLKSKGMSFKNAFVSNALCCPSRATIMRGQYSHNTGVWRNSLQRGWRSYRSHGNEQDNVATRLDAAGYRTGLFGKYLNGYGTRTYVPPGWDRWFAMSRYGRGGYYNYDVNDNGTKRHYGTKVSHYSTDVLRRKTQEFIGTSVAQSKPFFAYVAPHAPHAPATPARRHAHTYDGRKAPRLPSFNERGVSDKPHWIRQLPRLSTHKIATIDARHEQRAESLQAVDDLVAGVVSKLNNAGVLSKTYIFFTSDNGWHAGEHRIPGHKWRPYEEDIRVPLLVRGPGVAAGSTTYRLALNTDYLPTFTSLVGAQTPSYVDGRSLQPVLKGNATPWRNAFLLEAAKHYSPAYRGIRTSTNRKYVAYADSRARELYYLGADPYELRNRYNAAAPPTGLASRLQALKNCSGASCRAAENSQ